MTIAVDRVVGDAWAGATEPLAGGAASPGQWLGGRRLVGSRPEDPLDYVALVRAGLRYAAFDHLLARLGLSVTEAAEALSLAPRTLTRRKRAGHLDAHDSERVLRLARVAAAAEPVLGSATAVPRWLRTPVRALGGVTPLSLLDTDVGTQAVLETLGRLEHGVFG